MIGARQPVLLNLGCGFNKLPGYVNVDAYDNCQPDVVHDLNVRPYPWADNSVDGIVCAHTLEHIKDWWGAFTEMARILRYGGELEIRVPDESSRTALTYRDHFHVFSDLSFFGIVGYRHGTNAWAYGERDSVPLVMKSNIRVPYPQYNWMGKWCPWLLAFCANHMRNFIWEQQFIFVKVGSKT